MRVSPLVLTLALLLLLASIQVVPANAAKVLQCTANAGSACTLTFNLNNGDKVSGSISISGGSANDINFYVTNPSGAQIYNAGRVTGGTTFSFTADSSGAYILHLDNGFSLLSSKQVTVSYDVSGGGGGIPEFPPQLSIAVVVAFLVVVSYLLVRRFGTLQSGRPTVTERIGT